MLVAAHMDQEFWSLAVDCANHVRNRSPHISAPDNQPPFSLFRMAKPSIAHSRIFGCACYPVLDLAKRHKFRATVIKGVFVGYQAHSAAYKVFFPETGKLRV
jgi:hypothetical protein